MHLISRIVLITAGLALVAGCSTPAAGPAPAPGSAPAASGAAADQLAFRATTLDGLPFSGESLRGKPAVLWFWAPWCTTCKREAKGVAEAAAANPGVTFVGVSARDQPAAMKQFVGEYQLSGFTHLNDGQGAVWNRFGVTQQPAFAFIAKDGSVQVVADNLSAEELSGRLAELNRS
jgi:thiol-disulfide isomerase/thioredoxin